MGSTGLACWNALCSSETFYVESNRFAMHLQSSQYQVRLCFQSLRGRWGARCGLPRALPMLDAFMGWLFDASLLWEAWNGILDWQVGRQTGIHSAEASNEAMRAAARRRWSACLFLGKQTPSGY
jgi:hypothetical protein